MDKAKLYDGFFDAYRDLRSLKEQKKEVVKELDKSIREAQETLEQYAKAIEDENSAQLRLAK
jgi:hypothetical protein